MKPEWRDPEYGYRLRRVQACQRALPHRPLVLLFGSSRAQMSVAPTAMEFPDEPGAPLVYNFGYRGAHPLGVWLQFARALDDGVKPQAVLVMLSVPEYALDGPAEDLFPQWGPRLSGDDLQRFAPYTKDPAVHRADVTAARRNPWAAHRAALTSAFAPHLNPVIARYDYEGWERMALDGWTPFPMERLDDAARTRLSELARATHAAAFRAPLPGAMSDRALHDLVARCQGEHIPVALLWAPESPRYRELYTPAAHERVAAYSSALTTELGVAMFPAPTHLEEEDFADGYHATPEGAMKYSQWLTNTYLRPWLLQVLR